MQLRRTRTAAPLLAGEGLMPDTVSTEQINRVRSLPRHSAATATLSMVGNGVHSFNVCDSVLLHVDLWSQKHGFGGPSPRALSGFFERAIGVWEYRSEYAWAEYPVICGIVLVRFGWKEPRWMDAQAVPACGGRQSIDGAATPREPYATCVSWSAESGSVVFPGPRSPRC
jgi:hypothetical protein